MACAHDAEVAEEYEREPDEQRRPPTDLPVSALFFSAVANPVEAFRLATLTSFQGSLDVLGPAGTYAVDRFGAGLDALLIGVLGLWLVAPTVIAWHRFTRRKDL